MTFIPAPWAWPKSVTSVLVTAPTWEPITLDQAKLAAGLDWPAGDPRDDQMTGYIKAAREQVERDTGLALPQQTRHVTMTLVPGAPMPLPMQALPLQSITTLEPAPVNVSVIVDGGCYYPAALLAPVTTTYEIVSGWPDAASLAQEAPLLVKAVAILAAHYATFGRDLATPDLRAVQVMPHAYSEAVNAHRLIWVA